MNSFVLAALMASPMAFIKANNTAAIAAGLGLKCSLPAAEFVDFMKMNNEEDDDRTVEGCYVYVRSLSQ